MVIFSILRPKNRDKLATPTNILISQLSMADFLVGALMVPSFILGQKMGWPNNYIGCIFNLIFCIQVPPIVSYMGCLFLCLERYLAIEHPFTWERIVNKRTVIIISIITWTVPIAILHIIFGYNKGWNRMNICLYGLIVKLDFTVYITHFVLRVAPLLAMIVMYTKIFFTARRHLMAVVPAPGVQAPGAPAGVKAQHQATGQQDGQPKVSLGKQIRTAQKCFVIVAVVILFLIPQTFSSLLNFYAGWSNKLFQISSAVLLIINSAINPFMYARSNARLKAEIAKLLCFWKDSGNFDRSFQRDCSVNSAGT